MLEFPAASNVAARRVKTHAAHFAVLSVT
jgi:hypothetical protein